MPRSGPFFSVLAIWATVAVAGCAHPPPANQPCDAFEPVEFSEALAGALGEFACVVVLGHLSTLDRYQEVRYQIWTYDFHASPSTNASKIFVQFNSLMGFDMEDHPGFDITQRWQVEGRFRAFDEPSNQSERYIFAHHIERA